MFEKFLKSIEFIPLLLDPSVFTNKKVIISELTLVVYVDNIFMVGEHKKDIF